MQIQIERLPNSYSAAKASNSAYYYTGRPCVHGHIAKRRTRQADCYECHRADQRRRIAAKAAMRDAEAFFAAVVNVAKEVTAAIASPLTIQVGFSSISGAPAPHYYPVQPEKRKFQNV